MGGGEEGFIKLALYRVLSSVQFSHSVVSDSLRPHGLQHTKASLSITNSQSLLKLMSVESVMPSNHLILCRPLLFLPAIFPSTGFSNESVLHIRWPKYWSFSFSIRPSNEYSGLISFSMYRKIILNTREDFPKPGLIEGFPIYKGQKALAS